MFYYELLVTLVLSVFISIPNLVQIGQELGKMDPFVYFPRQRPTHTWISKKCCFGPPVTRGLPISISTPNMVQIDQELAKICPFVYFPRWQPLRFWLSHQTPQNWGPLGVQICIFVRVSFVAKIHAMRRRNAIKEFWVQIENVLSIIAQAAYKDFHEHRRFDTPPHHPHAIWTNR